MKTSDTILLLIIIFVLTFCSFWVGHHVSNNKINKLDYKLLCKPVKFMPAKNNIVIECIKVR